MQFIDDVMEFNRSPEAQAFFVGDRADRPASLRILEVMMDKWWEMFVGILMPLRQQCRTTQHWPVKYWHYVHAISVYAHMLYSLYEPLIVEVLRTEGSGMQGLGTAQRLAMQRLHAAACMVGDEVVGECLTHNPAFHGLQHAWLEVGLFRTALVHVLWAMVHRHHPDGGHVERAALHAAEQHLRVLDGLSPFSHAATTLFIPNLGALLGLLRPPRPCLTWV
jgi:uncharacterized membrane protein